MKQQQQDISDRPCISKKVVADTTADVPAETCPLERDVRQNDEMTDDSANISSLTTETGTLKKDIKIGLMCLRNIREHMHNEKYPNG